MNPTRPRTLVFVAVVSATFSYVMFQLLYGTLPLVPWSASVTTFGLAVAEGFWAPAVRARLEGRPRTKPIMPIAVARTAAFAKASSALGGILTGWWVGVLAHVLPRAGRLDAARTDSWRAGVGLGTALMLVAAALWLERVCRVPPPPPEQPPGA